MRILGADSFVGRLTSISAIPVNIINDHDFCIVRIESDNSDYTPAVYFFEYVKNDGNPENIPYVIIPQDNIVGDDGGRWKLKDIFVDNIRARNVITNNIISEVSGTPITIGESFSVTPSGAMIEGQLNISSLLTEPPMVVNSDIMVENLNAEFLGGESVSNFVKNFNFNTSIPNGVAEFDVYFTHDIINPPNYTVFVDICNTVDLNPSIYSYIVVRKEQEYFTIRFSGVIDSPNYTLHYLIIGDMETTYVPPIIEPVGSTGVVWSNIDSDVSAAIGKGYFVNTTLVPVTIRLPIGIGVGSRIEISDYNGTFSTNNCIVDCSGSKIMGLPENFVCDVSGTSLILIYSGTTYGWKILDYTIL